MLPLRSDVNHRLGIQSGRWLGSRQRGSAPTLSSGSSQFRIRATSTVNVFLAVQRVNPTHAL